MRDALSLRSYMKRAAQNRLHDEVKRASRRPMADELPEDAPSSAPCPMRQAIGREDLWRCRVAFARLRPADRRLIALALTGEHTAQTLAANTGKRSRDAARMALSRAVRRLAMEMDRLR
jgi:DNA-directed RNA polymerase specialized sigma24 family protein